MGLMERFERSLSEEEARKAEEDAMRMLSGDFDFNDFYQQLDQISQLGSMSELMEMMLKEIRRRRYLLTVPWKMAELQGKILGMLPSPPLTEDQVTMLKTDNVVHEGVPGLADLGVEPTAVEAILPTYMIRFRPGGRFASRLAG